MRFVRKQHGPPFMMLEEILAAIILILSTGVSACSLCANNGQEIAITNPDKSLGITSPVSLETCLDLSNALAFIADDSDLCSTAKSLSSLCGCPVTATACTICEEGSTMALPLQVLDGLVDLNVSGSSFGLDTTCELVESAINLYDRTEQRCLDLPFDQLRQICSCSTDGEVVVADDMTCNLCVGGEMIVHMPESSFIHEGTLISCLDAAQLANNTEKGSDVCNAMQDAGTICGCPVSTNACELCGRGGVLGEVYKEIVLESGEVTTCILLEAKLHLVERSSQECSIITDTYASECGCMAELEFQPCTLCPLGEPVPYPERNVSGIEGLGFDYIEHNCGNLDKYISLYGRKSVGCQSAQAIGKLCGCSVKENACSVCGDAIIMQKPLAEAKWATKKIDNVLSPELAATIDADRPFTCELVDSALSLFLDADSDTCFQVHLTRVVFCGCDGSSSVKIKSVIWVPRCVGAVSLLGSICIIYFILSRPRNTRWSIFHQLMFGISLFDSLSAIGFVLGTFPVTDSSGIYDSYGTEATCNFEGWMFQAGLTSMFYNVALSTYFLLVIKHDWSDRRFQQIGKYVHTGLVFIGLALAFASIPFHEPGYRWCYIGWPPIGSSYVPGLVFFILPVGLCILVITVLTVQLVRYVNLVDKKSRRTSLSKKEGSSSMANRTFWQSLWYLAAFYLVWPVMLSTFVLRPSPQNFWFYIAGSLLVPSQGFFNACIFFNRRRKAIRKKILKMLGIQCKPNVSAKPNQDYQASANKVEANNVEANNVEPAIATTAYPVATSFDNLNTRSSMKEESSLLSGVECGPNVGEDCKEEVEFSSSLGALEHTRWSGLCADHESKGDFG